MSIFNQAINDDRYIPRRISPLINLNEDKKKFFYLECVHECKSLVYNFGIKQLHVKNYKKTLREQLFPSFSSKILNFSPTNKSNNNNNNNKNKEIKVKINAWPIRDSRRKPLMVGPIQVLDSPGIDVHDYRYHLIDWSSQDCAATIYLGEVYMWYPSATLKSSNIAINNKRRVTNTGGMVKGYVKWNKSGSLLAIDIACTQVFLFCNDLEKRLPEVFKSCKCGSWCQIYTVEWLTDVILFIGCSKGFVSMINVENCDPPKICIYNYNHSIIKISISCKKTFLATSDTHKRIKIWKMSGFELFIQIKADQITNVLAWHPWKESILAIGGESISIWNVNLKQMLIKMKENQMLNSRVDALTFNSISGELVATFTQKHNFILKSGVIVVYSNQSMITEALGCHKGNIPYLLWNSDNTYLLSAGIEGCSIIWEFFGSKKIKKSKKLSFLDYEVIR